MLKLFRGACLGLSAMHDYRMKSKVSVNSNPTPVPRDLLQHSTRSAPAPPSREPSPAPGAGRRIGHEVEHDHDDDDNERHELLDRHHRDEELEEEGRTEAKGYAPLATKSRGGVADVHVLIDGNDELSRIAENTRTNGSTMEGTHVPYAHRDVKPASVFFDHV